MNFYKNEDLIRGINNINMQISDNAVAYLDSSWHCEGVCSPFTRIYCVKSGSGRLTYEGGKIEMHSGAVYIIPSGFRFGYSCGGKLTKLFFHIRLPGEDNYDYMSDLGMIVTLDNKEKLIDDMITDYSSNDVFSAVRLKSALYNTLQEAFLHTGNKGKELKSYSELILSTISYIENNLRLSLKTKEIAEKLFISESMLQKQFKREVGITPGKYIDDRIMQAAETDLGNGKLNLKDISEKYGFCDQFYFSRKFTAVYGISPQKYRKIMIRK